jgi:8-oxo-dGTP diphosphatase
MTSSETISPSYMIRVTCAIIECNGEVLITQRSASMSQPLLWEFPGGKVEAGETDKSCLVREILEELNLNVTPHKGLTPSICTYSFKTVILIPFLCSLDGGELKLLEHADSRWVGVEELLDFNWCPADIPIVKEYILLKNNKRKP